MEVEGLKIQIGKHAITTFISDDHSLSVRLYFTSFNYIPFRCIFIKKTMDQFILYSIYFHAACGLVALISGGIALSTPKGGKVHRMAGKFYFGGMTGVFITAIYVSLYKHIPFLLMVGFFSYHMICSGYRSLYLKKLHLDQKPAWIDWLIIAVAGIFNLCLTGWGIWQWMNDEKLGIVALVFGLIGLQFVYRDMRKFFKKPENKNHWIISHISGMIGGYIATWTAFLVVNITFLPPLLLWLGPIVVGVPFIIYHTRKVVPN
jgi:uncharacterized membrane protein